MRRGGGAGSGTVLHCQRQAVSLHRFLFEIQEGLELCLKGERERGSYLTPSLNHDALPGTPIFSSNRGGADPVTGILGWPIPARMLGQEVGGTVERSQICGDEVSLRRYTGCSSILYCAVR